MATLRHAHKDAIRNFINNKFRIFQARPDAIHEICRPGPARARGVEARPEAIYKFCRPEPGPARKARGPGPGLNTTLQPQSLGELNIIIFV